MSSLALLGRVAGGRVQLGPRRLWPDDAPVPSTPSVGGTRIVLTAKYEHLRGMKRAIEAQLAECADGPADAALLEEDRST
jgi:hypothetical protein